MSELGKQTELELPVGSPEGLESVRHSFWARKGQSLSDGLTGQEARAVEPAPSRFSFLNRESLGSTAVIAGSLAVGMIAHRPALASRLEEVAGVLGPAGKSLNRGEEEASSLIADEVHRGASGKIFGYRFVEIRPTDPHVPEFDIGVQIKDTGILGDKPNLTARNPETSSSMALSALYLPAGRLPKSGLTLAIDERTADSLTAMAVLANRTEKRAVAAPVVKLIAEGGAQSSDTGVLRSFKAISFMAEAEGIKLGDRIRFVRAVLDGSATPAVLEERARKFDALLASKASPVKEAAAHEPGIKQLRAELNFGFGQPGPSARGNFDIALGVSRKELIGDAQVIDRSGRVGIIERVLFLRGNELPKPGAQVLISEVDTNRLTAAALLELRADGVPARTSLLQLIQRGGSGYERVPAEKRENVVAAWEALEGFGNDPMLSLSRKVAAVKNLLSHDVPAQELSALRREFAIFRPSTQPLRYIRTTEFKPKSYDLGVEITDPSLQVPGKPNLDHHGPGAGADTPSASEQALLLNDDALPERGARVAVQKPDADALTAVAVLANRVDGLPVNRRLVEAIGRHDRGMELDPQGHSYRDVETYLLAVRSVARNENILINQRIATIRSILAGQTSEQSLASRVEHFRMNKWSAEVNTQKTSIVHDVVPGRLAFVTTPRQNWFDARAFGLERAPVAVIAAQEGGKTHFEVVARAGHPAGANLGLALAELSKLEAWGGRAEIFVSPGNSDLSAQRVLDIVRKHLVDADR